MPDSSETLTTISGVVGRDEPTAQSERRAQAAEAPYRTLMDSRYVPPLSEYFKEAEEAKSLMDVADSATDPLIQKTYGDAADNIYDSARQQLEEEVLPQIMSDQIERAKAPKPVLN